MESHFEIRRFKDIIAVKKNAKIIGFHARNLDVAELDEVAWDAFLHSTPRTSLARQEIELWNLEESDSSSDEHIEQKTTTFVVNITQVCNLRCTYCAAGGDGSYGDKKGKVDLALVEKQILEKLKPLQKGEVLHLQFFGGEPLLHPEAIRHLSAFARLASAGTGVLVRFSITTNATLISPEIAELLASIKCSINISLDGPPELNDVRRPDATGKPSTEKAITGLKNLMKVRARLGSVVITGVFGKSNLSLVDAYRFYSQFDLDLINLSYEISADEDRSALKKFLNQYSEVLDEAASKGESELLKISSVRRYFQSLDTRTRSWNHCGAGKNLTFSDIRGQQFACAWLINDKAEMLSTPQEEIRANIEAYVDPLVELNSCQDCWARFLCGGGCMVANKTKTGNKHKKDFEYCVRTRAQIALSLLKYSELRKNEGVADEAH